MTGDAPSRTHRGLDAETVITIVRDQFPDVPAETAELLGEGTSSYAYVVDGSRVFRFPKTKESEVELALELKVLEEIAANSPLPLPAIPV
jgi:hypothetical protein